MYICVYVGLFIVEICASTSVKETLISCKSLPCNPAAETALQPLI